MKTKVESMNVAGWSRGLSEQQLNAIETLSEVLLDDFEQGTSFRVKKCLKNLGLNPMISNKKISQMIQLSRGNDLAFLFFILEAYYKVVEPSCGKKQKKIYTSNEQLLMTAIKELDLMMTLRELDRILPISHPKEVPVDTNEPKDNDKCVLENHKVPSQKKKIEKTKTSPYFLKQPRPKEKEPMKLKSKTQGTTVASFEFWEVGKPPVYKVTNEKRWFSEYNFNPSLRVVKDCLNMALDGLFDQIDEQDADSIASRKPSRSVVEFHSEIPTKTPNLCDHHKVWTEELQLQQDMVKVQARDRCLKVIDTTLRHRTIQRARIAKQLENAINQLACKYENLQYAKVALLKGEKCEFCKKLVFVPSVHPKAPKMISGEGDISHPITAKRYKTLRISGGTAHIDLLPESDLSDDKECVKLLTQYQKELKEQKVRHRRDGCPPQRKIKFSHNFERLHLVKCSDHMESDNKWYFKSPGAHKPFTFNHKRIFRNVDRPIDYQTVIHKSGMKALRFPHQLDNTESELLTENKEPSKSTSSNILSNACASNPVIDLIENHKSKIVDAVHEYVKKVFEQHKLAREQQQARENEELKDVAIKPLKYDEITHFDPNDVKLMNRLLKDGMEVLREDPRFVLASLPDSHKLRVLQEWIKRRYGKIYTKQEEEEELNSSQEILKNVIESISGPPLMDAMGISTGTTSYAERDKSMKLAKKIKEKYYNHLNEVTLGQIGLCYMAVESFFPKATFFAYLPAHSNVINRHHPWNSLEFRDLKLIRKK